MAEGEAVGEVHGDGPFPGSWNHYMYCAQHPLYGSGALPHDRRVQHDALCGKSGKGLLILGTGMFPVFISRLW